VFLKSNVFSSTLKQALAYYNAGVVVANSKVVGLDPATDVLVLKIFSPKNLAKIFAFFAQTTVSVCKNYNHYIGF
jgi:hypothetical protein